MIGCFLQDGKIKKVMRIMSDKTSFKQRLLAVLNYDGIPQSKRAAHIANACGCSRSTARRLQTVESNVGKINSLWLFKLAEGLNVNWLWLYDGNFERFDPRTARIQLSEIERRPCDEVEMNIAHLLTGVEGEPDYLPVGYGKSLMIVMGFELRRRLTEWERDKHTRFCLRLLNNDKKANRLSDMCIRGQITRMQLFSMM